MRLEINGRMIADPIDPGAIAPLLRALPPDDEAIIALHAAADGAAMQAGGTPRGGFAAHVRRGDGEQWRSKNHRLAPGTVAGLLVSFAAGDRRWRSLVAWEAVGRPRRNGWAALGRVPVVAWALLIFGLPYLAVVIPAVRRGGAGAPGIDSAVAGFATIVALALFLGYLQFFFAVVRPLLLRLAARLIGVGIREGDGGGWLGQAGGWEAGKDAPLGRSLIVILLDAAILLLGIVGPVAAVAIPLFLLAERFGWGSTR